MRGGTIEGISDLRDESDREGMRIVVVLKRDAFPQVVLNKLFAHTYMQSVITSYSIHYTKLYDTTFEKIMKLEKDTLKLYNRKQNPTLKQE